MVECGVEEADNLRAFVVDDRLRLLVPEYRYSEPRYATSEDMPYTAPQVETPTCPCTPDWLCGIAP